MDDSTKLTPLDPVLYEPSPELQRAIEAVVDKLVGAEAAIAEAFADLDVPAVLDRLRADQLAIEEALPSREDYWVDLWTFSTFPFPGGLGLTSDEFWHMTSREWLARYRVWKFYHDGRPAKSDRSTTVAGLNSQPAGASALEVKLEAPAPVAAVAPASKPGARRGYRAEVREWMKLKELRTIPAAARRLAVGVDTLKSIMSDKGDKRYSDDTLKAVLEKLRKSAS
jgi:hypothetical protein